MSCRPPEAIPSADGNGEVCFPEIVAQPSEKVWTSAYQICVCRRAAGNIPSDCMDRIVQFWNAGVISMKWGCNFEVCPQYILILWDVSMIVMIFAGFFTTSSICSLQKNSMVLMFICCHPIRSHLRSGMTHDSFHISQHALQQLMDHYWMPLSLKLIWLAIRVGKAAFLPISLLPANSLFCSVIYSVGGREVLLTVACLTMHVKLIFQSFQEHTIWQMLDFLCATLFWYHIKVSSTIWRSGSKLISGALTCCIASVSSLMCF